MNPNEQNENPAPLKTLNLESFHDLMKEEDTHTVRFTGQFNPVFSKENQEAESSSIEESPIKIIDILKNVFIYKLPLTFLIVYIILVVNYVTLIYFMIGLLLINLEFENYYLKIIRPSPLSTPLKSNITLYKKINFRSLLYIVLIFCSLVLFIFKVIYCFLLMFDTFAVSRFSADPKFLENFDIYFDSTFKTKNVILSFIPNFFTFMIPLILVMLKNESKTTEAWDLNLEKEFSILKVLNSFIIVCFILVPAFDFHFIGLFFYFALLISILLNAVKRFHEKIIVILYWFYQFIKVILLLVFFLNYFGGIEIKNNNFNLKDHGFLNFSFLGIDSFTHIDSVDVF